MKKSIFSRAKRLLFCLLLVLPGMIFGQPQEVRNAMDAISKFTSAGGHDMTTAMLRETGFTVPSNLEAEWRHFPAYRKLETAYWAAAKRGDQDLLLQVLVARLHQEFESVPFEPALKRYAHTTPPAGSRVRFGDLLDLHLPATIDGDVAASLLSISKYTDAQALGGVRGVLKFECELNDEAVYRILRESNGDFDALLKGIELAQVPPEKMERIRAMIEKLREESAAASVDRELTAILMEKPRIKAPAGVAARQELSKGAAIESYDRFLQQRHLDVPEAQKFSNLRTNANGFGGVIFGNVVTTAPGLGKIQYISWIHNSDPKTASGTLECRFANGKSGSITGIRLEDIYAAYTIIYNDGKSLTPGNGIGLTGAYYPDVYSEDRTYDSLVRSFGFSSKELEIYTFRGEFARFINEFNSFYKQAEKKQTDLVALVKSARTQETRYRAALNYLNEHEADSIKLIDYLDVYHKDSAREGRLERVYPAEWKRVRFSIDRCYQIVLHPAVANLELGRCLIRADAMPRAGKMLADKISRDGVTADEVNLCHRWLDGSDTMGWKFTDDRLFVGVNGGQVIVSRAAEQILSKDSKGYLIFNTITHKGKREVSTDIPYFPSVLRHLTLTYEDYDRLNQFTKVMTIVRLARQDGAVFLNKPGKPNFVKRPVYCKVDDSGEVELVDEP